ncbi:hypothetical protein SAMN05421780_108195 [Flexibacter flexilis DSM 6793]|uniref:Uncharacterized protein n=1 Tax=Flexibacter flexilis DSM 6793 TaxID=927664 RepID=A0A1I1LPJ2_9BACT|nr:hypothetical protein [Flexibacter flexilis]SFC71390.1 hypothetical protein SAMN05421780_108195 [Flexibacter flexilis DSM 6793]
MAKKNNHTAEKPQRTPEEIAALREEAKAKFNVSTGSEVQPLAEATQGAEAIQAAPEQVEPQAIAQEQEATQGAGFSEELVQAAEAEADRIAAEEAAQAAAQTLPQIMVQIAEQVQDLATNQMIESLQKSEEANQIAEQARAEARINAEALRIAQEELKQAKAEAEAAKEAARIAEEQAELNRRLIPKILAAERAERIEQAQHLSTVLNNLESRKMVLESILRTADDSINLKITGTFGQNVDFSNKNLCKEILTILREKVEEAINQKQTELNCFTL